MLETRLANGEWGLVPPDLESASVREAIDESAADANEKAWMERGSIPPLSWPDGPGLTVLVATVGIARAAARTRGSFVRVDRNQIATALGVDYRIVCPILFHAASAQASTAFQRAVSSHAACLALPGLPPARGTQLL